MGARAVAVVVLAVIAACLQVAALLPVWRQVKLRQSAMARVDAPVDWRDELIADHTHSATPVQDERLLWELGHLTRVGRGEMNLVVAAGLGGIVLTLAAAVVAAA